MGPQGLEPNTIVITCLYVYILNTYVVKKYFVFVCIYYDAQGLIITLKLTHN